MDITDGKVTSSGCGTGKAFFAYDGDISVSGGTVSVPYSHTALDGRNVNITGGTLTLAGSSAGIFAPENVNISGGTISGETTNTENGCIHAYAGDINISGGTLSASGGTSALRAPAGEINIVPASDRELAVSAGESAGSAAEIAGSPFSEAAAIGELVEGQKYFRSADPIPFTDVSRSNWYYDAVKYVYTNGLMDGTAADTFAPGSTMTRRMVWAILARMDGESITGTNWAGDARAWAMTDGISDGEDPNGLVTRQQLIVMLYRFAGAPDVTGSLSAFADESSVSGWARDAMAWAVEAGLLTGTTLDPQGAATRSQAAAMLMRFADSIK